VPYTLSLQQGGSSYPVATNFGQQTETRFAKFEESTLKLTISGSDHFPATYSAEDYVFYLCYSTKCSDFTLKYQYDCIPKLEFKSDPIVY